MEIKRISNEDMNEIVRYNLVNGDGAAGLSTAAGSVLEIEEYVIYDSFDMVNNTDKTVLALITIDGEYFATTSKTCIDAFEKIVESFKTLPAIEFYEGTSKKNRKFLMCKPAIK